LAVRRLAHRAAVLRRHPDREVAFLGQAGVVHHQHGIRAANLPVGLFGQHTPQRRVVPGRAADEMVQLVMPGQPEPLGHRLDALAPATAQQPADIQRRHCAAGLASGCVEERLEPGVKLRGNIARQRNGRRRLHA
jgi:hypothetical protein